MIKTINFIIAMVCCSLVFGQQNKFEFNFSGQKNDRKNEVSIHSIMAYSPNLGYGFDLFSKDNVQLIGAGDKQSLYAKNPFYFSVKVAEGNYKVSIFYKGLSDKGIYSTVRSESRRWSLENIFVGKNKRVVKSFVVNIKDAKIDDKSSVKLKLPREVEKLDWDNKLTLEFHGENNIEKIRIEPITTITTVFLAGNSTVTNQEHEPWASWGQMIPRYFNTKISIANHAESGLALSSFLSSNRLDKILSVAKPGDYLVIEFGHNDQKEKGDKAGAFNGYTERLKLFVQKFKAIGGHPIIITSTARRAFDEKGNLNFTLGDYPQAARKVAKELNVPLIDLNTMTRDFYQTLGIEKSKQAFVHYPANTFPDQTQPLQDNTHFNTYGAGQIAKMILQGMKDLNIPISKNMIDFKKYNPNSPDDFQSWHWPLSTLSSQQKPDGN